MKILKGYIALVAIVFALSNSTASAQYALPNGPFSFDFPTNVTVWDVSGTYSINKEDYQMTFTINADAAGKITGSGTASGVFKGVALQSDFKVTGSITRSTTSTKISMKCPLGGVVNYNGKNVKWSGSVTFSGTVDNATKVLSVDRTVSVSAAGKSGTSKSHADIALAEWQQDGSLTVTLNLQTAKNKMTGTGSFALSNGRNLDGTISGTYNPKKGTSTYTLTGVGTAKGSKLVISTIGGTNMTPTIVTGNVMGQAVKVRAK